MIFIAAEQSADSAVKITKLRKRATEHVMRFGELVAALSDHGFASLDHLCQLAVIVERAREVEISLREIRLLLRLRGEAR